MASQKHVAIVRQGAAAILEWRKTNPKEPFDLIGAKLPSAYLACCEMARANLTNANLSYANLTDADLTGANLTRADLSGAILSDAKLTGADLTDVQCCGTNWCDIDLSTVKALDTITHHGPSEIGIQTLLRSGAEIPQSFLEGCGVPDNWITYLPSLLGKPIDFYSCFISYSHQDEDFCKRLHSRMREDKLRVWYAPEDVRAGEKLHEQIESAIRLHDKLLVVLSEHSMQSGWVKTEIRAARQREVDEDRRVLFPIRLVPFDATENWKAFDRKTGKDMAEEIREYFIPDFSNWKDHDSFEESYKRLMKDFKPAPDDCD